jgi:hypothetical protein
MKVTIKIKSFGYKVCNNHFIEYVLHNIHSVDITCILSFIFTAVQL